MSDISASSREPSPDFREHSPDSDNESISPASSWQGSEHPSNQHSASSGTQLLRQPVGFGAHGTDRPSHYHPSSSAPSHRYPTPTGYNDVRPHASQNKSSKGKGKEVNRSKEMSNGKHRDDIAYPPIQAHPGAPLQRTFRVHEYTNDPSATGAPPLVQEGPYGAAYRATIPEEPKSRSQAKKQRKGARVQNAQAADLQPRASYYRHDYEKIRASAPANREKQQALRNAASAVSPSPSSHHGSRSDAPHMYNNYGYPSPQPYYNGDTSTSYDFSQDTYIDPHFPPSQPPQHAFAYPALTPATIPAPPKEKRHHKSRSHKHGQSQSQPLPPQQQHHPPPLPQPPVRVVRVLTLLIEDKRNGEEMLAEVRVPLRPADPGDTGMWADAQEVSEELQKGPSRIDGRAKVYTMRGKYKQLFLRIRDDGQHVCQPANLKVSPERTLEMFVEDNPPPAGTVHTPAPPPFTMHSPPRDLPTPVTDSMTSPSPAPSQTPFFSQKRPSHSSLFSADLDQDEFMSPPRSEHKFAIEGSTSPKKRPRSSSVQSLQSVAPHPPQHEDFSSAFEPGSPDMVSMSTAQSRTAAYVSQTQSSQQPASSNFTAESPETTHVPPRVPSSSGLAAQSSPFSQTQTQTQPYDSIPSSTPSRSVSASSSSSTGPPPPKKAKTDRLQVPQQTQQQRKEHSVSPAPSRPGAFPFSDTRTATKPTATGQRAVSGFEAYANKPPTSFVGPSMGAFGSTSLTTSGAFGQFNAGAFSLPKTQPSEPSPSVSLLMSLPSTVPDLKTAPGPPPEMTTVPPSAMTIAPTLSGQASTELDNAVRNYIRGIICKEPQWAAFGEARKRMLTMREQLEQYRYVQSVQARFVGHPTPADLQGAGGVLITRQQVVKAFNMKQEWGEECEEVMALVRMHGEGGTCGADPRVVEILDEVPPVTTSIQVQKFLRVLRAVHAQYTMSMDG